MEKIRMKGDFKVVVSRKDESTGLYKNDVTTVNGFMYQVGSYQYFIHLNKRFNRLEITESSTGFGVRKVKRNVGESLKQCYDRVIEEMKGINESLCNWEVAKSMMKRDGIHYPLNEWITELKDINKE